MWKFLARDGTCTTAVTMVDPEPTKPPGNSRKQVFYLTGGGKRIKIQEFPLWWCSDPVLL